MKKTKANVLEFIIFIVLSYTLIFNKFLGSRMKAAVLLSFFAILAHLILRKKRMLSIRKKDVLKLVVLLGFIYVAILYTIGIYAGYYKALIKFSASTFLNYILPIAIMILASETLRNKFLSYENKITIVLNFVIQVIIDLLIYANIYKINKFDDIMLIIGYVLFASISNNLLFNYIGKRYGTKPNIIYRLLTTLYIYIIPITPDIYIFFLSFYRMFFPLLIYYIIESFYGEEEDALQLKGDKAIRIVTSVSMIILIIYIGLISCMFKYGALVIGSGSMTGTIDKGDVIVFKKGIKAEDVEKNEIIVFNKNDIKVVHRVIDKKETSNEYRFYTKGDANKKQDEGYVSEEELYGNVVLRVKKIGLPTIWLHDMFDRSKEG